MEEQEFEDIQLEDTNSDMDPTSIHSDRGKGTGEDEDRMEFRNLVSALQDLAKGHQLLALQGQRIHQLISKGTLVHM